MNTCFWFWICSRLVLMKFLLRLLWNKLLICEILFFTWLLGIGDLIILVHHWWRESPLSSIFHRIILSMRWLLLNLRSNWCGLIAVTHFRMCQGSRSVNNGLLHWHRSLIRIACWSRLDIWIGLLIVHRWWLLVLLLLNRIDSHLQACCSNLCLACHVRHNGLALSPS